MSDKEVITDIPFIKNTNDLQVLVKDLYIISDYIHSRKRYNRLLETLYSYIKGCYHIRECREYPIYFKMYPTTETHIMEFRHFIINLILWQPLGLINSDYRVLENAQIFDCKHVNKFTQLYINDFLLPLLREYKVPSTKINKSIADLNYFIGNRIGCDFSLLLNLNFSAKTFIDYMEDPETSPYINVEIDTKAQPAENEKIINEAGDKFINILKNRPDDPIGVMLRTGTGIKPKQLIEYTISQGYKPTLTGETIPIIIKNSIMKGDREASDLFISASGARKSQVMNKSVMGKAGYFAKCVSILAGTIQMSATVSDCGSTHLLKIFITNKAKLKCYNGCFYKLTKDEPDYSVINAKKDTDLIGRFIYCRSISTCACQPEVRAYGPEKGQTVDVFCPKCFGVEAFLNKDIKEGVSIFLGQEVTKVVQQNILSTKHLLTTLSENIEFSEDFYRFFSLINGEIYAQTLNNPFILNIEDYAIYINPDDISKDNELDEDSLINTMITNGTIYIRNIKDSSIPDIPIKCESTDEIYISSKVHDILENNKNLIKFTDITDDDKLFEIIINNNELTKPLYEIMSTINKKKDGSETIETMVERLVNLFIESGIKVNAAAAAIIVNRLTRCVDDVYRRPDFRRNKIEPISIISMNKALEKNPSPLVGLSTQYLMRQLMSDDLFSKNRQKSSFFDDFYKEEVPTEYVGIYTNRYYNRRKEEQEEEERERRQEEESDQRSSHQI